MRNRYYIVAFELAKLPNRSPIPAAVERNGLSVSIVNGEKERDRLTKQLSSIDHLAIAGPFHTRPEFTTPESLLMYGEQMLDRI